MTVAVVGTDNLEIVGDFAVDLALQVASSLKDGKITTAEALGFLPIGLKIPTVIKAIPATVGEVKDLSQDEQKDLIAHIAYRFKTSDLAVAENVATELLNVLAGLHRLGAAVKDLKR